MNKISEMSFVSIVHRTEGRYDLIIKIEADSEERLKEIVSGNINKIPGVDATISLPIAKDHLTR
jgi:DNA-binding Lrp family transcriptional regulator